MNQSPQSPSIAQRALDRIMPAREAPQQPVEVNPFQKALDDYDRVARDLMVTKDALTTSEQKLLTAYNENEALQARYDRDTDDYRQRESVARAEVNALGRSMVELATQVAAIGDILGTAVNQTIKAREIVQRFQDRFKEEIEREASESGVDIAETLRNLPQNDYR